MKTMLCFPTNQKVNVIDGTTEKVQPETLIMTRFCQKKCGNFSPNLDTQRTNESYDIHRSAVPDLSCSTTYDSLRGVKGRARQQKSVPSMQSHTFIERTNDTKATRTHSLMVFIMSLISSPDLLTSQVKSRNN